MEILVIKDLWILSNSLSLRLKFRATSPFSVSSESGLIYETTPLFASNWLLGFNKSQSTPNVQLNCNRHSAPHLGDAIVMRGICRLTFHCFCKRYYIVNLDEEINAACLKCTNKHSRKSNEYGLCSVAVSLLDSLPVRCVGSWAKDKIYFLTRYFEIFAGGMKNKFDLNYIEICSGPGRCICREEKRV